MDELQKLSNIVNALYSMSPEYNVAYVTAETSKHQKSSGCKGRPEHKADNLTSVCELIV
jgi:hypothetical protein